MTSMLSDDEKRARLASLAASIVQVPVFWCTDAKGWPDHAAGAEPKYTSLPAALRATHDTDAHFAAYSVPRIARRLNTRAVGHPDLPDGIPLVVFVVDVDDTETHTANARDGGKRVAPDAWRESMRERVSALRAEHPAFVAYETRGGFRLLALLATPHVIRDAASDAAWRVFYGRALGWLHRSYGITGDPSCHDWTRFFRLPCVVRTKGETAQRWPMHGDAPGRWEPLQPGDAAADLEALRALEKEHAAHNPRDPRNPWRALAQRVEKALSPAPRLPEIAPRRRPVMPGSPEEAERDNEWRETMAQREAEDREDNARTRPSSTAGQGGGRAPMNGRARRTTWARSVIEHEARAVAAAAPGSRNTTLYNAALRAFRCAMDSDLSADEVFATLQRADGGAHPTTDGTLESARRAAEQHGPAEMPERERQQPQQRTRRGPTANDTDDGADLDAGDDDARADLPVILTGTDLARQVTDAVRAIGRHREVFQQHPSGLVRVIIAPAAMSPNANGAAPDEGAPVVDALSHPVATSWLTTVVQFRARDRRVKTGDGTRAVHPPAPVVAAMLGERSYPSDLVRPLRGVIETPALRPDGTVITTPGYDAATQMLLHWCGEPVEVPQNPTRDDAREAFAVMLEPFTDFRFAGDAASQDIMRAAAVASVLTPIARPAIVGPVPASMWEADGPGAGKSLAAKVCAIIATGRASPRPFTTDDDEMRKVLLSVARNGTSVVFFDNVHDTVRGGAFESAITGTRIAGRVLGATNDSEFPFSAAFFLTGNDVSYSADMARRMLHMRILRRGETVASDEGTTERVFRFPELEEHVTANRRRYITAALTILRAHRLAGSPRAGVLDGFEAWSRVVSSAVWWASGADPVRARPPVEKNASRAAAMEVAHAWYAALGAGERTTLRALMLRCRGTDPSRPGAEGPRAAQFARLGVALAELCHATTLERVTTTALSKPFNRDVAGKTFPCDAGALVIDAVAHPQGVALYQLRMVSAVDTSTHPAPMPSPRGREGEAIVHPDDLPELPPSGGVGGVRWTSQAIDLGIASGVKGAPEGGEGRERFDA